ncbi:MAG: hypothetical protein V4760_14550, partial [Bdellovibrionota bacterium]
MMLATRISQLSTAVALVALSSIAFAQNQGANNNMFPPIPGGNPGQQQPAYPTPQPMSYSAPALPTAQDTD